MSHPCINTPVVPVVPHNWSYGTIIPGGGIGINEMVVELGPVPGEVLVLPEVPLSGGGGPGPDVPVPGITQPPGIPTDTTCTLDFCDDLGQPVPVPVTEPNMCCLFLFIIGMAVGAVIENWRKRSE